MMVTKAIWGAALLAISAMGGSAIAQDAPQTLAGEATEAGLTGAERRAYILERLTVEEKLGQLHQMPGGRSKNLNSRLNDAELDRVRSGLVGSYLHVAGAEPLENLQRVAVEESRTGIPLLFAMDVVHGYKTIFPVPLALASSFDPALVEATARAAGSEASAAGLHWTFAPMVDIARDARWGRIVEGAGEEPYLGAVMAAAQVRGYQGDDLSAGDTILATAKHLGAYGAGQGGRDYDTAEISERALREIYLPPFKAAADAGTATYMVAFNDIAGVPTTANKRLLTGILRDLWGFDGMVVSDWNSVMELMNHGVAGTPADAGALALAAGVDMEMTSGIYVGEMVDRVKSDPELMKALDLSVTRILLTKDRLGLFDDPYAYHDTEREAEVILSEAHRVLAREAARKSMVLLKNDGALPVTEDVKRIAVIGALADDASSPLGSWRAQGQAENVSTILEGLEAALPEGARLDYVAGADTKDMPARSELRRAVNAAKKADLVLLVIGEDYDLSGEARSRSDIGLPAPQAALAEVVLETDTPVAVLLMNGRPLDISMLSEEADAILETWMLGVETGPAVADIVFGKASPGGKLPASFPRRTGQSPYYMGHHPTGRPADPDVTKDTARYMDIDITPLYPFGHGLSYVVFSYGDAAMDRDSMGEGETLTLSVDVTNDGTMAADEVVQLYTRDPLADVARPQAELRGFVRVTLAPGETKSVSFTLTPEQFAYWGPDGEWQVDAGAINYMIGSSSADIRTSGSFMIEEGVSADGPAAAIETKVSVEGASEETLPRSIGRIERFSRRADALIAPNATIERLTPDLFGWSEGPVWMEERREVLFTDVPGNTMYGWSEEGGLRTALEPSGYAGPPTDIFREPGANGLIADGPDAILMGDHGNRAVARLDLNTMEKTFLATEYDGKKFSSPNDLVRASDGALYFTDPPYGLAGIEDSPAKEMPWNGVYRLAPDGSVTLIDDELTKPNGVGLSPDGKTLYVAVSDPDAAKLYAYDVQGDGSATNRRVFHDAMPFIERGEQGLPDGMAIDAVGNVYLAGPGGIHLLSPEGDLLALIRTGTLAANVTLAEGGRTLFITSGAFLARVHLDGKE
ncbi:glycoside hydrolase family 3 N-terminal domain-containing protein [Parvularcula marina]|uniref:Beta-D-glucoside glucohydrolase n=1 Tax=Parvularcula marina TaxID=2292771 RepID=A0A371R811_9PROT|nr:glycoside hydrolase family 3 N-terminal domain-containing protein [Parvularcula marina]RFB01587.1 hypothetical protein DX908_15005 [Parvularcula marina]